MPAAADAACLMHASPFAAPTSALSDDATYAPACRNPGASDNCGLGGRPSTYPGASNGYVVCSLLRHHPRRWNLTRLTTTQQGFDLEGNSFWEFKETLGAQRFRRIVKYSRRTHYGDVKLTRTLPAVHQFLAHVNATTSTPIF